MTIFDTDAFNERLFFPRSDVSTPPEGAVDLTVSVPGASLHLRLHRSVAPETRCTVLLFHGNGEVVADDDDAAPAYARSGASLAVVDFRGYGASTGTPTLRSTLSDSALVLQAVVDALGDDAPLIVMGRSLGSACACELYRHRPQRVRGFILESGATDLAALVRRRGLVLPAQEPSDLAVFDPIPKLERGDHPLLVIHGANDQMIVPAEAERAYAVAGTSKKSLVLIPDRGHNDVSWSPQYWSAIGDFVQTVA